MYRNIEKKEDKVEEEVARDEEFGVEDDKEEDGDEVFVEEEAS